MPTKYASKLENIYLVALCNSSNFKETGCSEDSVFEEITRDLEIAETESIISASGFKLNVGLFDFSGDNLGLNVSCGFSGGFNAEFFCTFCTCTKDETHSLTNEDILKRRTVLHYAEQIEKLHSNPTLTLKETFGIHKNCFFNNLKHFHVISHPSVDIMHDVCEGVIPKFLREFFRYCIAKKILMKMI